MSTISLPSLDSLAPTYESNESSTFSLSTTSSRSSSISGEEGDRPQVAQQMQSQSTALSHNHQEAVLSCFSGIDARRRHQATEEELARLDDLFPKGVEVDINDQESNLRQEDDRNSLLLEIGSFHDGCHQGDENQGVPITAMLHELESLQNGAQFS